VNKKFSASESPLAILVIIVFSSTLSNIKPAKEKHRKKIRIWLIVFNILREFANSIDIKQTTKKHSTILLGGFYESFVSISFGNFISTNKYKCTGL